MSETPPVFQEAPRCDVCNCSFTTFRRRHHCRSCGRTLCHDHSSNHMALPQFGLFSDVRVCDDCFNSAPKPGRDGSKISADTIGTVTDRFLRINVGEDDSSKARSTPSEPISSVTDCKCGMPLCICKASIPDPVSSQVQNSTASTIQPNPRPKKLTSTQQTTEPIPKKDASSSTSRQSSFFNLGQASNDGVNEVSPNYEVSGEGLREAIKNSSVNAVRKLLAEGVDANFCDKQGLTLLHLAALFNQTEIAFILMDHGANVQCKNAQGETPLDCAPTMLQHKMRQKMEEGNVLPQSSDQL